MSKYRGKCFYCLEYGDLCEAHIIPQSFFGDVESKNLKEVSTELSYIKRSRVGPYDEKILCAKCDNILGAYDGYAKSLLVDNIFKFRDKRHAFYSVRKDCLDYEKFKKFFISLLWRACISTHPVFSVVSLGVYRELALRCLKSAEPLSDGLFGIIIFKDAPSLSFSDVTTCVGARLATKHAYALHFSGYQIFIVPNATGMNWKTSGTEDSYWSRLFLERGKDLVILEVNEDLSGKEECLLRYQKSLFGRR